MQRAFKSRYLKKKQTNCYTIVVYKVSITKNSKPYLFCLSNIQLLHTNK